MGLFPETFDGRPSAPQTSGNSHNSDIFSTGLDARENGSYAQLAHHGPGCNPPGYPYSAANRHPMTSTADQVFIRNDHLMTATGRTGYGAIYMVSPAMAAGFSAGTATIKWDTTTLRTVARDWVYFTPRLRPSGNIGYPPARRRGVTWLDDQVSTWSPRATAATTALGYPNLPG